MDNVTIIDVAATRLGAALLGARSPWTDVIAAGAEHALRHTLVPAAGAPDARRHATSRPVQVMSAQTTQLPPFAAVMGVELLPTLDAVNVARKPENVHKTRINAGGYGAMGPHPERERLA